MSSTAASGRARRVVRAIVHEPLVHFVVAGAALFAFVALREERGPAEIRISSADVAQLAAYWESQAQRKPTPAELHDLVEDRIDEEVLAQEALRFDLDKDDVIIRRRLAQKMSFISEDLAVVAEPSEQSLREYFQAHRSTYASPELYAVRQVFFSVDSRAKTLAADTQFALRKLTQGADAGAFGDPFMLPSEFADVSRADIVRDLGSEFADAVASAPLATWQGPVRSSFGLHLLRVESRSPMKEAQFEEVREQVRDAYLAEQRQEANAAFRAELRRKYRIIVEDASEGGGT